MNQIDRSRARGPIAVAVASALACGEAMGQSSVPQVTAGSATVERTSPDATKVLQHSERAVLDWNSLSLSAGQSLEFLQPSASSAVLNRVRAGSPSVIDGLMRANGMVFVVNPSGVLIGPNGTIDVGGFLATTSQIGTGDFMAGRLAFAPTEESTGTVKNRGLISIAEGGFAALVAPHVVNSGVIQAHGGRVVLSGQPYFTVDLYGDQLIRFGMPADASLPGSLLLTANGVSDVVEGTINLDGVRNADTITRAGDAIVLSSGRIDMDGVIDTSSALGKGGSIDLLAAQVNVSGTGRLDSRGAAAGGNIHLGGNERGAGERPHAMQVNVADGAVIDSSGVGHGSAGKVVLWSDGSTSLRGLVRATGGKQGGDGGFVEISGKHSLQVLGDVLNGAPSGRSGTILLDPRDLFVAEPGQRSNDAAVVSAAFINEQLRRGVPVELVADRSITVAAPIDGHGSTSGGAVSLSADSILLLAPVMTNNGAITITANNGSIQFEANAYLLVGSSDPGANGLGSADISLTANGGNVRAGHVATLGTIRVNAPTGSVEFAHALAGLTIGDLLDPVSTGVGNLVVRAAGDVTLHGGDFASVSIESSGGGITNLENTLIARQGGVALEASGNLMLEGDAGSGVAVDVQSDDGDAVLRTSQGTQLQGSIRTAGGDILLAGLDGGRQAVIETGDSIVLQAGDQATDSGGIQLMSVGDIDVGSLVTGSSGQIVADSQSGTVNLRAPVSGFAIAGAVSGEEAAHGVGALTVRAGSSSGDAIRIGEVVTNSPLGVTVSTAGGVLFTADVIARNGGITVGAADASAQAPLSIDAQGVLQTVSAMGGTGATITLNSRGDIHATDLIAGPGAIIQATASNGSVTTGRVSGVGTAAVDRVLLNANGGALEVGEVVAQRDVRLRAAQDVTLLGDVIAGEGVEGSAIDIQAGGLVTGRDAGTAVRLQAGHDAAAAHDIDISAGSHVHLDALIAGAGADVTIATSSGDVKIDNAVTGMETDSGASGVGSLTIAAGGSVELPGALAVGSEGGIDIVAGGAGDGITVGVDASNALSASNAGLVATGSRGIVLRAAGNITLHTVPSAPVDEGLVSDAAGLVAENGPVSITSTGGSVSVMDDVSTGAPGTAAPVISIVARGDIHVEDLRAGSAASIELVSNGLDGNIRMDRPLRGQPASPDEEDPTQSEFAGIGSLTARANGDIYFSGAQIEGSGVTLDAGGHLRMRGQLHSRGPVRLGNPEATGYIHLDNHIYTFGQPVTFRNDVRVLENLVWSTGGTLVFRDYMDDGTYVEVPLGEELSALANQFALGDEDKADSCNQYDSESGRCIGARADLLAERLCEGRYPCASVDHEDYERILVLNGDRARLLFSHDAFYRLDESGVATSLLARGVDYNTGLDDFGSTSPDLDVEEKIAAELAAAEQRVNFLSRLLSPVTVTIQTDTEGSSGAAVVFEGEATLLRSSYEDVYGGSTPDSILYPSSTRAQGARPDRNCPGCDFLSSKNLDVPLSYVNGALHLSLGGELLEYSGQVGSEFLFQASMAGPDGGFPVLGSFSISGGGLSDEQLHWVNDSSVEDRRPTLPQFNYAGTQYSPRSGEGSATGYQPAAGGVRFASNVFTSVGVTSGLGSASPASAGASMISGGSGGSGSNPNAEVLVVEDGDAESADRATSGDGTHDDGTDATQVNRCPRGASRSADVGTASPQDGTAPDVFSMCAPDLSPPPTLETVATR